MERERLDNRAIEKMGGKVHPAAPAPGKGSGKKGGKGKGSAGKGGKGAGKGQNRSQSAKGNRKGGKGNSGNGANSGLCVFFVVSGSCPRGSDCSFKHERPKDDAEEKYYRELHVRIKSQSRSPGPKGKGKGSGVCLSWKNNGTCKYGDQCKYKHENTPAAPASAKGRRRSYSRGRSPGAKGRAKGADPAAPAQGTPPVGVQGSIS